MSLNLGDRYETFNFGYLPNKASYSSSSSTHYHNITFLGLTNLKKSKVCSISKSIFKEKLNIWQKYNKNQHTLASQQLPDLRMVIEHPSQAKVEKILAFPLESCLG